MSKGGHARWLATTRDKLMGVLNFDPATTPQSLLFMSFPVALRWDASSHWPSDEKLATYARRPQMPTRGALPLGVSSKTRQEAWIPASEPTSSALLLCKGALWSAIWLPRVVKRPSLPRLSGARRGLHGEGTSA